MTNCTCPHRFGAPYHDDECPAVKQRSYTTATHAMTTDHEPACDCGVSIMPALNHAPSCPAHPANAEAVATETRRFKVRSLCQASKEASDLPNDWNQVVQANVAHRLQRELAEAKRERDELRSQLATAQAEVQRLTADKQICDWIEEWAACITHGRPNTGRDYMMHNPSRSTITAEIQKLTDSTTRTP